MYVVEGEWKIEEARLAYGGVAPKTLTAFKAEKILNRNSLNETTMRNAIKAVAEDINMSPNAPGNLIKSFIIQSHERSRYDNPQCNYPLWRWTDCVSLSLISILNNIKLPTPAYISCTRIFAWWQNLPSAVVVQVSRIAWIVAPFFCSCTQGASFSVFHNLKKYESDALWGSLILNPIHHSDIVLHLKVTTELKSVPPYYIDFDLGLKCFDRASENYIFVGGMVEYRMSLAASFLFRFFVEVSTSLRQEFPEISFSEALPQEYESAIQKFKRPSAKGIQYFTKTKDGQVVGAPDRHMAADLQVFFFHTFYLILHFLSLSHMFSIQASLLHTCWRILN